jgi:hypothetical protein
MPYTEQVVLPSGRLFVFLEEKRYRLDYAGLVVYENGKRTVRGRTTRYEFRSVEQMRYDFENDVKAL